MLAASIVPAHATPKRMLVLHSYHKGFQWTENVQQGIELSLAEATGDSPELFVEYMDTKRFSPDRVFPQLQKLYAELYSSLQPDVILTSDDNAFNFMIAYGKELFPGVPVVFCGVNNFQDEIIAGRDNFTGVLEDYDLRSTISLALDLHPQAKHVVVITDSTPTGALNLKRFRDVIEKFSKRVDPIELSDMTSTELRAALKGLPSDSIIINLSFFRDRAGETYSTREGNQFIVQNTELPIYSCWDFYLGTGIIGGKLVSGVAQGVAATEMALSILKGTPVADIPILRKSPNIFMFDYGPMRDAGLSEAQLPEGSEIINYPKSLYHQHKDKIWAALAIMAIMAILILGMAVNILRRKQAESQLRLALLDLQSIFDNSQVGILMLRGGRVAYKANQRLADIFGYKSADNLEGQSVAIFHASQEAYEDFGRRHYNTLVNGQRLHVEYLAKRKNGSPVWINISGKAVDSASPPDLTKGVIWTLDDITERKRAEFALRDARNYIRNIIDSMPSILVGVDVAGRVTQWNSAAHKATGIAPDSATGKVIYELMPWLEIGMDSLRESMRSGEPHTLNSQPVMIQEETHYTDITIFPLIGSDTQGAVLIVDDVSERVRMEEIIVQHEKMMSVGGLAAGMAHEINNPLSGILGAVQNTLKRISPDFEPNLAVANKLGVNLTDMYSYLEQRGILRFLEGIQNSGTRAAEIVRNMLNFSRASSGEKVPQDLRTLLDATVDLASKDYNLKDGYDFKAIIITREYAPDLPMVNVIAPEIGQVFLNLLNNAAQAMSEKMPITKDAAITLRLLSEREFVRMEIQDNGPGIDADQRKKIFEPFYTTKGPGKGTGLGLSVSYFIVTRNHGGTLTVESTPGQGSTFIVCLPIAHSKLL